jgi:hypothetical protein
LILSEEKQYFDKDIITKEQYTLYSYKNVTMPLSRFSKIPPQKQNPNHKMNTLSLAPILPSPSAEPRLTFGVEIELVLATLGPYDEDPHKHDHRQVKSITDPTAAWTVVERGKKAFNCVAGTLNKANIPAFCDGRGWNPEMKEWTLADDVTIDEPDIENYTFIRVELWSPPLYFTEEACQQVQAVCEVLTNSYRIICPESAGLHVHVGNETNNFSGSALQKNPGDFVDIRTSNRVTSSSASY